MLNTSELKKIAKEQEKRVGKDFIDAFDRKVRQALEKAVNLNLGKRKTLQAEDVEKIFND
ncbi:MAG TPA: hypothetical protein VMW42_01865 [Desulfatiglandales bacterium]|nr:hypothetical protein [Desulfatiglandales bacterium]